MKTPPKEPCLHIGGIAGPEGDHLVKCWILPDHYNQQAKRWKMYEGRGYVIQTRSEFAGKLRYMRQQGFKVNYAYGILANYIHFRLLEELEKDRKTKRRKGRKAVAV